MHNSSNHYDQTPNNNEAKGEQPETIFNTYSVRLLLLGLIDIY